MRAWRLNQLGSLARTLRVSLSLKSCNSPAVSGPSMRWRLRTYPGECLERLSGDAAADLVTMVSVLPWGEQARCHIPRYGLRAQLHGGALLALSICFECNNARTFRDSDRGWFTFDGSSPEAMRLLERLRQARS